MPPKTIPELREMQKAMWRVVPPTDNSYGRWDEVGTIQSPEVEAVLAAIAEHRLVCELTTVAFGFGQIGINLYLDEPFPGVGPEFVFCLSENHLDHEAYPWVNESTGGNVHPKAWELFHAAREPQNVARLKALGLKVETIGSLSY